MFLTLQMPMSNVWVYRVNVACIHNNANVVWQPMVPLKGSQRPQGAIVAWLRITGLSPLSHHARSMV